MSIRYIYNLSVALAAGFMVVASLVFSPLTAAWIGFAIAVGITAVTLGYGAVPGIGLAHRGLAGVTTVLGIWTIIASLVFVPTTAAVLCFASALGFVGLAVIGLSAHELTTERVVHSFEVAPSAAEERQPIAA